MIERSQKFGPFSWLKDCWNSIGGKHHSIVDKEIIDKMDSVISKDEIALFDYNYSPLSHFKKLDKNLEK